MSGRTHDIVLIADIGHGREGFDLDQLTAAAKLLSNTPQVRLAGVSVYLCRSEPIKLLSARLAELSKRLQELCKTTNMDRIGLSAGSSLFFGKAVCHSDLFRNITDYRIGTSALLGISTSIGPKYIDFPTPETFHLEMDLIQLKGDKLILPIGICDTDPKDLFFDEGFEVEEIFSDHLVLKRPKDCDMNENSTITCRLNYYSLNRLFMSPYVQFLIQ